MTPRGKVAAGPAKRLLDAFCLLAGGETEAPPTEREAVPGWFADEPKRVDCERHPGRFDVEGIKEFRVQPPSIRVTSLGVASARGDGPAGVVMDLRLAAAVISDESPTEFHGDRARRLAERVCFELVRGQEGPDGRDLWPQAAFSAAELDPGHPGDSRWEDIGDPRDIRAANLYDSGPQKRKISIWAVTWLQQFRARSQDFDLPLPEPAGIPETVKTGRAPDIGPGHEGDYESVVPRGGADMPLRDAGGLAPEWRPSDSSDPTVLSLHCGSPPGAGEAVRQAWIGERFERQADGQFRNLDALEFPASPAGQAPTHIAVQCAGVICLAGRLPAGAGSGPVRIEARSLSLSPVPEGGA